MMNKLIFTLLFALIILMNAGCGEDEVDVAGGNPPIETGETIYFCKKGFKHDVKLEVQFFNGKSQIFTLDGKCENMSFSDSVKSVFVIRYDDIHELIIDTNVNNTRVTVRGLWGVIPNGIGAAIYKSLQAPIHDCDCFKTLLASTEGPKILGQKIKAVYMQDM